MSKVPIDAIRVGNIGELADLWGLTSWDKLDEMNLDYFWESAGSARDRAQEEGEEDEEKLEEIGNNEEQRIRDEMYSSWSNAVESTSEALFEVADLNIEKSELGNYFIYPTTNWRDSLKIIIEIINTLGLFHFSSVEALLDSGPYGLREAVDKHYTYLRQAHEVFDVPNPERLYTRNFRAV